MIETQSEIDALIGTLESGGKTITKLRHNGYLFLEHDIPFLMIYRNIPNDEATIRLARTGASYLIVGNDHFGYFEEFIQILTEKMSRKFRSFIIIEIYSGSIGSTEFVIRGPSHKLPISLDVLKDELNKIHSARYGGEFVSARIEQTKERQHPGKESFFDIDQIKSFGGTFIGLEVPPVYRNAQGTVFPLYFRRFRDGFATAIHKAVFEFIRVQTSSDIKNYAALGRRRIHEELFKIDRKLTEIEAMYQFLLLVAPVNINYVKDCFFKTKFQELPNYHYRLLPIDPDILKRRLYDLCIDEIDDPALSYLFEEKREEIDQELTMLKERGARNFFYSSLRLYGVIEKNVLQEAKDILENISEDFHQQKTKDLNATGFAELAREEFDFFKKQSADFACKIHIRDDVNGMMVSKGELYIPTNYEWTTKEAQALIQHEVGTHVLTYYNGSRQPLSQLAQGLANYDPLQEGMAVLSEYLIGGLTGNRLRTLAGRVIAGDALLDGADFKEVFLLLIKEYGFSEDPAFDITSRFFQGSGFLKDIIYLRGLIELIDYLKNNGDLEFLMSGKFALKHVPLIEDLMARGLLSEPKIKPKYMESAHFKTRMQELTNGMRIYEMI